MPSPALWDPHEVGPHTPVALCFAHPSARHRSRLGGLCFFSFTEFIRGLSGRVCIWEGCLNPSQGRTADRRVVSAGTSLFS